MKATFGQLDSYATRPAAQSEAGPGAFNFFLIFRFVPGYNSRTVLGYYVYCMHI